MAIADEFLYRINSTVLPAAYRPTRCGVIHPQPADGVVNFNQEPGGAQDFPYAVLTYENLISLAARQWWDQWIAAGAQFATLSELTLPDSETTNDASASGDTYEHHGEWTSATLWRIQLPDEYTEEYRYVDGVRTRVLVGGAFIVRITNLET